jgi:peroxin-7
MDAPFEPSAVFVMEDLAGYNLSWSPFTGNRFAVAAAQYYGIVGNGRCYVLDMLPNGMVGVVKFFDTKDGLFDVAWSEENENQLVTCSGDGSLRLWDLAHPRPIMAYVEHTAEVYGVDWDLQGKVRFFFFIICLFRPFFGCF